MSLHCRGLTGLPLERVVSPRVLPEFAACYSARLAGADHRLSFAAGRECVARAMQELTGRASAEEIPRGVGGEPVWPPGLTGSITHKDDFISAAVARRLDARSIGIDAERIVEPERAQRISRLILQPQEASVGGSELSHAVRVSLCFSIKEAVFKCLYPIVLQRFYYEALAVTEIDLPQSTFSSELTRDLGAGFRAGTVLRGCIRTDLSRVYTGIWLPPNSARDADPASKGDNSLPEDGLISPRGRQTRLL
jgi:enterobactin synthetase component D